MGILLTGLGPVSKTASQIADTVLEKQAVLARMYAAGRAAEEAVRRIPRINVGGPKLLVDPVAARTALGDVARKFRGEDIAARHLIKKKLGPATFEATNTAYRVLGLPAAGRRHFGLLVSADSPAWFTSPLLYPVPPVTLPAMAGKLTWTDLGPATTIIKALGKIPPRRDLIYQVLNARAKKKGFESLEQRLLFEEDPGYALTQILREIGKGGEYAYTKIYPHLPASLKRIIQKFKDRPFLR